ncbi:MAG: alkene reductase [Bdellovibrionaceae bacterium]|nr:alkene reductase [Pseudobdellovibrionaceae bacterium]
MTDILFQPLKVGDLTLPNRIIMAPLTRQRSGVERVPNDMMKEYYTQRASAGLILTEATAIDPMGVGYKDTPGIWNDAQIQGWKKITDAVHEKGGRIFLQLWHVGRISDPIFLNGETPVAPSAIAAAGHVSLVRPQRPYTTPRSLETAEVKALVQKYRQAGVHAQHAGFDGVEVHGANGYLIDQFLQTKTNQRTDAYGGSIQNRARFLLEIVDELIGVWGPGRIGVHLAPASDSHDMGDDNPKETFGFVARELGQRKIAFIFTREGQRENYLTAYLKKEFGGVLIANQGLDPVQAASLVKAGVADAISWGKYYISNPDLPEKIKKDLPFTPFQPETFYTEGPQGYIDYK